ncbi:MAG: OPT family oligopeptide transporter [Pirellulales bacterium]
MNHDYVPDDSQPADSPRPSPYPSPAGEPALPELPVDHDQEARDWLANVYQGDHIRQLSPRSIVTGMLIGGVMSISNLYVGLKTGWGLGVTITACIIAYAVFNVLQKVVPAYRDNHFTILENYTMSSAASAAGYMASAGLVSAIPALVMLTKRELAWWEIMPWLAAVSLLGVFMAIPLKRQLINIDKLPFPTGIATAETLRSMHSSGVEAMQKAKTLLRAAFLGAFVALWRDGWPAFWGWVGKFPGREKLGEALGRWAMPGEIPFYPEAIHRLFPGVMGGGTLMGRYTLGFEGSMIMIAAGAIMGIRVGISLLVGAFAYYGILAPVLMNRAIIHPDGGYRHIVSWTLWPATAMMVTSGLLAFGMKWRTVLRAFSGLGKLLGGKPSQDDPLAGIEVPGSWFLIGAGLSGLACVLLGHFLFEISWWMGIIAVLLTFVLSIVAARATGETDITPIGAMGKITQLTFGVISPSNVTTNLMTASITAGAASHSADLLTDLKSGHLLGGTPRMQTISQLFGVLAGTIVCVPVYMAVADPNKLGTKDLPAPSAQVWKSVAELLKEGIDNLPQGAVLGMAIGGVLGIIITLCEEFVPREYRKYIPSATGLGLAGVIPAFNSVSMFLGALGAWLLAKSRPEFAEKHTIAASSGLIAGESLMGVAVILAIDGPGMVRQLMASWGF